MILDASDVKPLGEQVRRAHPQSIELPHVLGHSLPSCGFPHDSRLPWRMSGLDMGQATQLQRGWNPGGNCGLRMLATASTTTVRMFVFINDAVIDDAVLKNTVLKVRLGQR